ncbi:MAG: helix-turn-helix transcriptional regulator [Bacteroidales bacterium]|nr:helix-turn-helix transcriptional regulator [Bacteroidales bacterium]
MLSRIQKLLDEKKLTVSSLADEIGVKRPTMTHTLTGRNNPSLDIITKILERFTDVSSDWLLLGNGTMYKSNVPIQKELFEDLPEYKPASNEQILSEKQLPQINEAEIRTIISTTSQRKIDKILLFYSDKSYETFIPESEKKSD